MYREGKTAYPFSCSSYDIAKSYITIIFPYFTYVRTEIIIKGTKQKYAR